MSRWVAIDVAIGDNPKVWRFAVELYGNRSYAHAATVGHLALVLGAVKVNASDGIVSEVPDAMLERWARWTGRRGRFATLFRRFFAADGSLHDWEEWNGRLVRQQEAERQRWHRRKARAAGVDSARERAPHSGGSAQSHSGGHSGGVSGGDSGETPRTQTLPTLPTNYDFSSAAGARDLGGGAAGAAIAAFLEALPDPHRRTWWEGEIAAWTNGMRPSGATPDDVDRGLRDYLSEERRDFAPAHVRSFIRRAVREREREQTAGAAEGSAPRGSATDLHRQIQGALSD